MPPSWGHLFSKIYYIRTLRTSLKINNDSREKRNNCSEPHDCIVSLPPGENNQNVHNSWGWPKPNARNREFIKASHMAGRNSTTWAVTYCIWRWIKQELGQGQDQTQASSYVICVPSNIVTTKPNTLTITNVFSSRDDLPSLFNDLKSELKIQTNTKGENRLYISPCVPFSTITEKKQKARIWKPNIL